LAGSMSAASGIRPTSAVSPGSTGCTSHGSRQYASTGVTFQLDTGMYSSGNNATGRTPPGSTPASSSASRRAVVTGPSSPGSAPPPGNATWPACDPSVSALRSNNTSGPSSPSPDNNNTAAGRRSEEHTSALQ